MTSQHDFLTLVQQRQSVRKYKSDPVDWTALERCLEVARLAPSACNSQPWTFVVVDEPELKNQVADATSDRLLPLNHFTKQAPIIVAIVIEQATMAARFGAALKRRPLPWIDLGIVAEHFCLQAAAEGLGTCMLGWFHEKRVRQLLGIPARKRIGLLITLGVSDHSRIREKQRKLLTDIACFNRYAQKDDSKEAGDVEG